MNKETKKTKPESIFRFWLILLLIATAIVITLIVFSFVFIDDLGLLSCLFVGLGMATLIVLTVFTTLSGINAYRG